MRIGRCGSWASPISAADLATRTLGLSPGRVDRGTAYWLESRPDQGGRTSLWRRGADGAESELTPDLNVRTAVNEYGGGEWAVAEGIVVISNYPAHDLVVIEEGRRRVLVTGGERRYASLSIDPVRRLVLAVRETHGADGASRQDLVALDLDGENTDGGRLIASDADFYASPTISYAGTVAWVEWDHPNMPWDTTSLVIAPLDDPGATTLVAGGVEESVLHPTWAADGSLLFLSDESGYWNLHRWDASGRTPLHRHRWDFCGPLWRLEPPPYAVLPDGRIGCTWLADGVARLGVLAPEGALTELPTEAVSIAFTGPGPAVVALLGFTDRPAEVHLLDLIDGRSSRLRSSAAGPASPSWVSRAQGRTWSSPDGEVHAWYYPPANPQWQPPPGELPPVQVWTHGGPTGFAAPDYRPAVQFWTSRGIGVLDVNYSGSAGYGRRYRRRLDGQWGVADVRDCLEAARRLVADGLADPARLSIRGSSAGGYTVLQALVGSELFAAGIILYGVGDLEALLTDTHAFEAHYTQNLVAPYPEGRAVYRERSPVHHVDRLSCPLLMLQGRQDRVVPPSQAEAIADAVRARGLPLAVVWFDEEGHGFRRAESIIATAEASLSFLGQLFGFVPAGEVPLLPIENLPGSGSVQVVPQDL